MGCGSGSAETDEATCGLIEIGLAKYSYLRPEWANAYADDELQKTHPDMASWEIDDMAQASVHKYYPEYTYLVDIYHGRSS